MGEALAALDQQLLQLCLVLPSQHAERLRLRLRLRLDLHTHRSNEPIRVESCAKCTHGTIKSPAPSKYGVPYLRVRVEIMGPGNYENVGESQSVLIIINPMNSTTAVHGYLLQLRTQRDCALSPRRRCSRLG
eukprot:COSAG01_NODE_4428_length_5032_cov_11.671666_7_plen_132_part_00